MFRVVSKQMLQLLLRWAGLGEWMDLSENSTLGQQALQAVEFCGGTAFRFVLCKGSLQILLS